VPPGFPVAYANEWSDAISETAKGSQSFLIKGRIRISTRIQFNAQGHKVTRADKATLLNNS
jgi:hypothetical protein